MDITTIEKRLPDKYIDISYDNFKLSNYIDSCSFSVGKNDLDDFTSKKAKVIEEEFTQLKAITDEDEAHVKRLYPGKEELNRYSDCVPYSENRVLLSTKRYINASFIHLPFDNAFIATQGPKENTTEDFWQMIFENNVKYIVMLCLLEEGGRQKCCKYWSSRVQMKNLALKLVSEEEKTEFLVIRSFTLTNGSDEKNITQLHFTGWPDHGVPDINAAYDTFLEIIKVVHSNFYDENSKLLDYPPVAVHCSAGVGRTGTFLTLYNLYHELMRQQGNEIFNFCIWNTIRKLKEMRIFIVENILQYKLVHSFVAKLLSSLLK